MILILSDILEQYINESLALGISIGIITSVILIASYGVDFITKKYLVNVIRTGISRVSYRWGEAILQHRVIQIFAHIAPAILIYLSANVYFIADIPATEVVVNIIKKISMAYMIIIMARALNAFVLSFNTIYSYYEISKKRPITSYVQVAKILIFVISAILIIATLLDKSPVAFFTGIGAAAAVITIIFKDSLLGFIASIQIAAYDMVRMNDWIQVDSYGANGTVEEISLNTVKVRNFDNTVSTIPTHILTSQGIKNWRFMEEAGGRRIKRKMYIDIRSIKFCDENLLEKLKKINYINEYIENAKKQVDEYNKKIPGGNEDFNGKTLTNIGCFRAYVTKYLINNDQIHSSNFIFMIRYKEVEDRGLPLEIFAFVKEIDWEKFEEIQSEIFEHLFAILSIFELRAFQAISGAELRERIVSTVQSSENK